jgi:pyruvate dehydrogenase E2 component (dihydrolipoamide acetyltransferase)
MAERVIMPKQGLQMTEGTITGWFVEEGETVTEGEPLFEMETDKLTITIDAGHSGTLLKILHGEGEVVPITHTIGIIGEPGEDYSDLLEDKEVCPNSVDEASLPTNQVELNSSDTQGGEKLSLSADKILSSPRARLRAEEFNIDLATVAGTGPDGLITEKDVLEHAQAASEAKIEDKTLQQTEEPLPGAREKILPLSNMRKIIAQRMHDSLQTMAQANHRITVDMTKAGELRKQFKELNMKISYNDIIIRCVAKALTDFPAMNATFSPSAIVQKQYVNIGMAVAVPTGLIVPVIRDANLKSLQEIAAATSELAQKAKEGTLSEEDYQEGTFTVSNLGMYDIDSFTAIINPPEIGILAVGKIAKQVVVGENDKMEIRPQMQLSLTYDHRAIDGAPAAQFLRRVKELLEYPALMI